MAGSGRQPSGEPCPQIVDQLSVNALDTGPIHAGSTEIVFRHYREPRARIPILVYDGLVIDDRHRVVDVSAAAIVPSTGTEAEAKAIRRPTHIAGSPVKMNPRRRPVGKRPGSPAPPTVGLVVVPATMVVGEPAPGLVADPGPAPSWIVAPASGTIGRPAHAHTRKPDVSVAGNIIPGSVIVEIVDSHVRGAAELGY